MSKIVQAVNAMISHAADIDPVVRGGEELFFCYKGKYFWGMQYSEVTAQSPKRRLMLYYYPDAKSVEQLATLDDWDNVRYVSYSDTGIGTTEAKQSYRDLFEILRQKAYGLDSVLDDIIGEE